MPETDDAIGAALDRAEQAVALRDKRGATSLGVMGRQLHTLSSTLDRTMQQSLRTLGDPETAPSSAATVVILSLAASVARRASRVLDARMRIQRQHGLSAAATDTHAMVDAMERLMGSRSPLTRADLVRGLEAGGLSESLLATQRASVERYGTALIREVNQTLYAGLRDGLSQRELVSQVSSLIARKRWMAERVVRTETARTYNAAVEASIRVYNQRGTPLGKKIIAFFDNRTAYDSVYVHGQIREAEGYFVDGAGRVYKYPPARPNDREVIIPWRTSWPEGSRTRAVPPDEMPTPPRRRDIVKTIPETSINVGG